MTMSGLFQPGDDSGPATSGHLLVGMIRDGWIIPGWPGLADMPKTHLTKFSAILDGVNTNGGPAPDLRRSQPEVRRSPHTPRRPGYRTADQTQRYQLADRKYA